MKIGLLSGLRITDILYIKRADVFKGEFWIKERKTKKKKKIILPKQIIKEAKQYDKLHHVKRSRFLFVNERTKKPYTRQAIYYHFDKLQKFLNNTRITPHSTRQTYAKEIFKKTHSIEKVRKALNHSSTNISKVYLQPNKRKGKEKNE